MHTKKIYGAVLGISAVAFGLAFAFYQPPATQAQTSSSSYCVPPSILGSSSNNAWCSTWSVKKWLTPINTDGQIDWRVYGSVGPSDWEVKGTLRQEGVDQNYTESWLLNRVSAVTKEDTNENGLQQRTLIRSNNDFVAPGSGAVLGKAEDLFVGSGYVGSAGARWNATYYGQRREGKDAQNSIITTYFAQEWKVQGALE